jgi:cation transport regulator
MKGKFKSKEELPKLIQIALPEDAQELYLKAYNKAWNTYEPETYPGKARDKVAHQAGWAAVEEEYVHDEGTGQWHRKEKTGNGEAGESFLGKLKSLI